MNSFRLLVHRILLVCLLAGLLASCQPQASAPQEAGVLAPPTATAQPLVAEAPPLPTATAAPQGTAAPAGGGVTSPADIDARVEELLAQMTLAEKIGQMTQVETNSINPQDITNLGIGSILSGGDGFPPAGNAPQDWVALVNGYQDYALRSRLGIPMIYGIDAVHGIGHLRGGTIFPQNIGLGAANDPDLMTRIGQATAREMLALGIPWNFAPVVAVPQDIRWGRTYEGYGENTDLVTSLGVAYLQGLQTAPAPGPAAPGQSLYVLATPKHFLGDGGTAWGSSVTVIQHPYLLDQGDMRVDEETLRAKFLPPYKAAIDAGAMSIMVSFSSWNGTKMHAQQYLLGEVLKGELGFRGFVVSDWQAIDQIPGDYYGDVVTSINAGLDMIMVPVDYLTFISTLTKAVSSGDVPVERIDDAVRRILRAKFALGLFDHPYADETLLATIGSDEHRALAAEAVHKSLVLLWNKDQTLPLAKDTPLIFVAGQGAIDIGMQSGGWTAGWQGKLGAITPGTTLLDGVKALAAEGSRVEFNRFGNFDKIVGADGKPALADVGIVVVGEEPYAEGIGDRADLSLSERDRTLIEKMRSRSHKLVVVVLSGRPLVLTEQLASLDALVAAWLPGSEGAAMADVLFGEVPFSGKLSYTWPRGNGQLPFDFANLPAEGCDAPLFPYGYGLTFEDTNPVIDLSCEEK